MAAKAAAAFLFLVLQIRTAQAIWLYLCTRQANHENQDDNNTLSSLDLTERNAPEHY